MRFILALSALLFAAVVPASAQGLLFRSVTVDASPIAARGYPTFARRVEAAVAPAVASAFADRVNPGDPRGLSLVIRVISVDLPLYTGAAREGGNDYMRSEALVVDSRGRVVGSVSVLSPVSPWTAATNLPVEIEEHRRMRALGTHAAYWLRNRLAL